MYYFIPRNEFYNAPDDSQERGMFHLVVGNSYSPRDEVRCIVELLDRSDNMLRVIDLSFTLYVGIMLM